MKKDWKDIEGQLVRIDIGSTYNEAQSSSTEAAIICFTTDGHIVLNGMDYVVDTDAFQNKVDKDDDAYMSAKHAADWCTTYILQGDASHPFLQGRLTEDTYNIGWMLDGYTYNNAVKIPLINEDQAGLVDSQSYTDYIQPLLKGEYDERIDGKVDKVSGKGLSANDFTDAYKTKLDGITAGANKYTLPAATASALGGVKVGQVYASGTILPTVATVNLRASDNMAVVPAATTSAAGVMTSTDKSKLNGIAGGAQVNVIEKVMVNGVDLTPDSAKRVNLGTLVTEDKLNAVIGTLTFSSVSSQFESLQSRMQNMEVTIGTGTNGLMSRVTALENLLKLA